MVAWILAKPKAPIAIFCIAATLGFSACRKQSKKLDPQFTAGRQALMRGEYTDAIDKLGHYLQQHPNGRLASRASFLTAKAHLGLGDIELARQNFMHTIQAHGDSEEAHKSRYKLAMLSLIEGDHAAARQRFEELVANPSGTLVPEASAMLRFLDPQRAGGEP